ncbi:MAG: hypothetical protein QXU40_00500 [Candidatus Pacearchaeota archaeon]
MAEEITILQHWIFTKFILPFLLIFFVLYGVLTKTKIFGDTKQLNALISFVIGLIFVGFVFPKVILSNLILFLSIAIIVVFISLLLLGFVAGDKGIKFEDAPKGLKWFIGVVIVLSVLIALLWAMGQEKTFLNKISNYLFYSSWSNTLWTNLVFVVAIIIAIAVIIGKSGGGK